MGIADDIDELATRMRSELDDLFDFGAQNDLIWEDFEDWVRKGHTVRARIVETGSEVTEVNLINSYPRYRIRYLQALSFVQLTTVFEAFLFDFLRLLLANDPRHLAQKRQIEVGVALSAVDRQALVLLIAERELNELKYDRPRAWFDYMNRIVKLGCPEEDEIERIAEMKAARDLLIHNSGIVNKTYLDKAAAKARHAVGDQAVIERTYFEDCWVLTKKLVGDVAATAKGRLSRPATP